MSFSNGDTFKNTNPFRIADEIRRIAGEVDSARPDAKGNLLITTRNQHQTEALLQQKTFLGKEAVVDCPIRLNTVEAYAYVPSLTEVDEDEITAELRDSGVIGVYRLRPTRGQVNPGLRLTIIGKSVPPKIRAGFQDIQLRPWKKSPLLCRRCAAYGHTMKHCRADYQRCLRCAEDHTTEDCRSTSSRCPHCGEGHAAWDRRCSKLRAYFDKQERPDAPPPVKPPSTETATQTSNPTRRDAATDSKPKTSTKQTECASPSTSTTASQTDDLPIFEGPVTIVEPPQEDGMPTPAPRRRQEQSTSPESEQRWDHRTTTLPGAELPPAAGTRASYKARTQHKPAAVEDERPELHDDDLMPTAKKTDQREDDHQHIFLYKNGSQPYGPVTQLYRYDVKIRVIDLNLRPGTKACRAASNGFYFDRPGGLRLYLQRPPSPLV